jgi:hypothetical protein
MPRCRTLPAERCWRTTPKKLAKDVVSQCQDLFKAINAMIPDIKLLGVKKIDMIKWPIIEAKVEVFRGNLEKIKLTLQLLMSVMIHASMFPRFVCLFVSGISLIDLTRL